MVPRGSRHFEALQTRRTARVRHAADQGLPGMTSTPATGVDFPAPRHAPMPTRHMPMPTRWLQCFLCHVLQVYQTRLRKALATSRLDSAVPPASVPCPSPGQTRLIVLAEGHASEQQQSSGCRRLCGGKPRHHRPRPNWGLRWSSALRETRELVSSGAGTHMGSSCAWVLNCPVGFAGKMHHAALRAATYARIVRMTRTAEAPRFSFPCHCCLVPITRCINAY